MAEKDEFLLEALKEDDDKKHSLEATIENSELKWGNSSEVAQLPAVYPSHSGSFSAFFSALSGVQTGIDLNSSPNEPIVDPAKPHRGMASMGNKGKGVEIELARAGASCGTEAEPARTRKKRKRKKALNETEPGSPQRSKTPYEIFSAERRSCLKITSHPMAGKPSEVVREMWRALPWDQKKPFYQKSREDRRRYKREIIEHEEKLKSNETSEV